MGIRPIDFKMAMPKSQEVSKVEQNNQDNLKFSLQNQLNEQNKTIQQQMQQVNDSEEISKSEIKDDEEKNNNEKEQQQENETAASQLLDHNSKEGNVGKDSTIGGEIDIKV